MFSMFGDPQLASHIFPDGTTHHRPTLFFMDKPMNTLASTCGMGARGRQADMLEEIYVVLGSSGAILLMYCLLRGGPCAEVPM